MLDAAKNAKNARERRELIKDELHTLMAGGRLFITEILLLDEPWRTLALEVADGVVVGAGGVPQYNGDPAFDFGQIRLILVDEGGEITEDVIKDERIPGTTKFQRVDRTLRHGADATLPHIRARRILRWNGWPIQNLYTNGRVLGGVVEWAWLEHKAQEPDTDQDTRDLYARLKARLERAASSTAPTPKSKSAAPHAA